MTSVGRLIEERDRVRTYWVQHLWVVTVLLGDVGNWWSMWSLRNAKSWSIYSFLLLLLLISAIYLMTILLFSSHLGGQRKHRSGEALLQESADLFFGDRRLVGSGLVL